MIIFTLQKDHAGYCKDVLQKAGAEDGGQLNKRWSQLKKMIVLVKTNDGMARTVMSMMKRR